MGSTREKGDRLSIESQGVTMTQRALWTTSDIAKAFRVGVSSVKRWTDSGALEAVRTFGGHRRYTLESIHRFARARGFPVDALPEIATDPSISETFEYEEIRRELLAALESGDAAAARRLVRHVETLREDRAAFLDRVVGATMRLIGDLWVEGVWSVEAEHRASYIVSDIVDRMRPASSGAKGLALLVCPPKEEHDLPLRMVRVILESNDWKTDYVGANLPWNEIRRAIDRRSPQMALMTSRSPEPFQSVDFRELVDHCHVHGVTLGVGGAWARGGMNRGRDRFLRFRSLRGFDRWLRSSGIEAN
jgi:MerR family transcriptional regulator, light-induced transcriptional regulator